MNYHAKYINLSHRKDRDFHMRDQLSRINLAVERFEALRPHECYTDPGKVQAMLNRTPGAIGCHFSQVAVMKEALELNKHAIIFEDDCVFCSDFDKRFDYVSTFCKHNNWDVIWFGASMHVNPPYWHRVNGSGMPPDCSARLGFDAKRTSDERMIRTYGCFATFAYMVNVESIQKIINMFDAHLPQSIGIDWLFIKLQPQLLCYTFVPGMVKQMDGKSDIGNGDTIWSGFLKLGPYVYQDRMEDFEPHKFNWNECN